MKSVIVLCLLFCFVIGGCAWLDTQLVPTYDEQGNEIGRTPTETIKAVADSVPYGNVALNVALLLLAGVAKFKQYKTEKGLVATVSAIKEASKDPALEVAVQKVKDAYLAPAQKCSGTQTLIKLILAKLA